MKVGGEGVRGSSRRHFAAEEKRGCERLWIRRWVVIGVAGDVVRGCEFVDWLSVGVEGMLWR